MKLFHIVLAATLLGLTQPAWAQQKISKKERKEKLEKAKADRLFIEGQRYLMLEDYDRAYFYFQKAKDIRPNEAAIHFKIAEILLKANRVDQALSYGMKAVEIDPDNKYYNLVMAEVFSKQGQPKKAAQILENLMANAGQNQNYILDLASLYLSSGDFDNALIALNKAEEYYGILEQLTLQKQRIYLRKNDLNGTIREGENLINAHPGNAQYVINLVEILYNNGRSAQALELLEKNLEIYPNQPELQLAAYALYKDMGDIDTAEDLIKQALAHPDLEGKTKAQAFADILQEIKTERKERLLTELESRMLETSGNDPDVLTVVGDRRLFNNQKEEALEYYRKSLAINPSNANVLQGIITTMFEMNKDFADIEKYTVMAVDEFPEKAEFWFFDGTAKLAQKKGAESSESLIKAKELNAGKNKQLLFLIEGQLGDAFHLVGKKEEAFASYEAVLKERPEDEHILNNYAYYLSLAKQDLDKARMMSEKLVKRFPKNATYLDTHAWVLFQLKDYEGAKKFMEQALANEEKPSGVMFEHFGDILYHLGQKSEALIYWKKAEGGEDTTEWLSKKIKDQKYYD